MKEKKDIKVNFRRILYYIWPEMKKHWVSFSFIFIGYGIGITFDALAKPLIYKAIIDSMSSGLARDVILSQVMHYFFLMCVVVVIHNIGFRIGDFSTSRFESKVMKHLYDLSFNRLLQHSYGFFSNNFSGSIIAKSKRFTRSFEMLIDVLSFQIWFSFFTLLGIFIILLPQVPILAYALFGWSIIYFLITILFIRKKIKYDSEEASADSLTTARFSDVITNILNVKIFSTDKQEESNFRAITANEENKRSKAWNFANIQNVSQATMMMVLQLGVLFTNIHFWYIGKVSLGTFVLVQTYMFSLLDILWNLGRSLTKAVKSMTDMQEVVDIFDTPIDILDSKKPEQLKIKSGHIVFHNVSFNYKKGMLVLENFNLEIAHGERVGLVGYSGAGKSTITKILLRFTDISKGSIEIDGQDIKKITQNDLRSIISYVPQESILFHRTIGENISYSKPGISRDEIIEVSKKAHADEFISKLPNGYDTMVGERGVKLSGGERQRVAIARAMLKDSPILILDEATSSLDSISEHYIQDAFNELMKGKTTIVIAHRLSTIQKMDRIIVLDAGKIVEEGTHKELLAKDGMYASLWNHQTGGFLE
ncbi:MAG: ABC transporter ATP-binding protein [Candidatus Pacebacteria bacterium]|nr:ABC transporter ATP-binding protein [Candidatus Paceibacterota bacterium]